MEYLEVKVSVPKEMAEFGAAICNLVAAVKEVGKDGFSISDIPAVIASAMVELPKAIEGMEKIAGEVSSDNVASVKLAGLLAGDLLKALK